MRLQLKYTELSNQIQISSAWQIEESLYSEKKKKLYIQLKELYSEKIKNNYFKSIFYVVYFKVRHFFYFKDRNWIRLTSKTLRKSLVVGDNNIFWVILLA